MVHILSVSLQCYSFPPPWSKTHEYLHQCDVLLLFFLSLTHPPLQKGNEVGQLPPCKKLDQASDFSNKILLIWSTYGPLWKRAHLYRQSLQRLSDNAISLSGTVILCTSKFTAAVSKQTTEGARKVWNADEFHRHTQVTTHSNLKAINHQEVVPWIFKSIMVKWIQFLFFLWIFGELMDKTD